MDRATVRTLQRVLSDAGHYNGATDGLRGPQSNAAVDRMLAARAGDLGMNFSPWSSKRRAIAALQIASKDQDIDVGPIDGLWGPRTDFALDALGEILATGQPPVMWRDQPAREDNPNHWPGQSEAELTAFYGPPCDVPLVRVTCPWRLTLDWDPTQTTGRISCHERAAESLQRILERVFDHYGEEKIRQLQLHLYGGSYNCRRMRGGSSWSTHAWGIAIDWNPSGNKLKWGRERAALARAEYDPWWDIWEDEGWLSLGRARNFDWMHVQAARL